MKVVIGAVDAREMPDLEAFVVTLAQNPDGSGWHISFQLLTAVFVGCDAALGIGPAGRNSAGTSRGAADCSWGVEQVRHYEDLGYLRPGVSNLLESGEKVAQGVGNHAETLRSCDKPSGRHRGKCAKVRISCLYRPGCTPIPKV